MIAHVPSKYRGSLSFSRITTSRRTRLKIMVSAVRFCPSAPLFFFVVSRLQKRGNHGFSRDSQIVPVIVPARYGGLSTAAGRVLNTSRVQWPAPAAHPSQPASPRYWRGGGVCRHERWRASNPSRPDHPNPRAHGAFYLKEAEGPRGHALFARLDLPQARRCRRRTLLHPLVGTHLASAVPCSSSNDCSTLRSELSVPKRSSVSLEQLDHI